MADLEGPHRRGAGDPAEVPRGRQRGGGRRAGGLRDGGDPDGDPEREDCAGVLVQAPVQDAGQPEEDGAGVHDRHDDAAREAGVQRGAADLQLRHLDDHRVHGEHVQETDDVHLVCGDDAAVLRDLDGAVCDQPAAGLQGQVAGQGCAGDDLPVLPGVQLWAERAAVPVPDGDPAVHDPDEGHQRVPADPADVADLQRVCELDCDGRDCVEVLHCVLLHHCCGAGDCDLHVCGDVGQDAGGGCGCVWGEPGERDRGQSSQRQGEHGVCGGGINRAGD
ncbi:hypothetical protein KL951_005388 [Ogataea haglerorum]|nr:hypothetical protein KL951_005388 [Ogataea haglerorum]